MKKMNSVALATLLVSATAAFSAPPETIGFDGTMPDLGAVQVESGHVYDYTFTSAPTDWLTQSGVWEMTNRWSCSPGWSWFGGRSEEVASLWNKRKFSGDFSVQFYYGFKMGMTGTAKWMERPADAAITVCGDGKNLGSGYSFIMGANDNEHSVLLRRGETVAESRAPEAILSSLADGRVDDAHMHRKWWFAKINRVGNHIECWLDNELLLAYDDPHPLDAGQIALWTYNNGIVLSRVQIFYANELRTVRKPSTVSHVAAVPHAAANR